MCGRFTVSYSYDELLKFLEEDLEIEVDYDLISDYSENYNVAPSNEILIITKVRDKYLLSKSKWGYINIRNNEIPKTIINIRSEKLGKNKIYQNSFRNNRSLVIADGFYEWDKSSKDVYYFHLKEKQKFFFLSLSSDYFDSNNEFVSTSAILTKEADDSIKEIHNRMPVMVNIKDALKWLDFNYAKDDIKPIINSINHTEITKYQVSKYVNKVSNNSIECLKEYKDVNLFNI
ncbi:hypothetical protein CI105_02315 [Candidatus Izimaplasma bacterium ZiA1]|uniref:SOS response-associated peptidase n=1 Tax=Candidatus Izimoplasma sp. ZiA1 TaxID=2024899 RepID=UPI000BAA854A|nr:hypothetical protein CI105_02315 [Candidatus Izimaplasma bacterium ZiA1]